MIMKPAEIQDAFAAFLDTFDSITGQPRDNDLTRLVKNTLRELVNIPSDRKKVKHNLIGLVLSNAGYEVSHEGHIFLVPAKRPSIYDKDIKDDALLVVRV